ncbi:hypothetical protein, partial [Kitasatospora sp. NPDC059599]|uniref:hypothetical protein n=1 Tax=Kitasatospora sp. NPDC059599 TaxID=3346880 RepID=UPI0036BD27A2
GGTCRAGATEQHRRRRRVGSEPAHRPAAGGSPVTASPACTAWFGIRTEHRLRREREEGAEAP